MNFDKTLHSVFVAVAAIAILFFASSCTLDFEQFETGDAGIEDAGDDDGGGGDADDLGPAEFGDECDVDDDCLDDGVCRGSVCLMPCADDSDCPDIANCFSVGDESLCAPRCTAHDDCEHIEDRDDLSCVYLVETRSFGASPHNVERACLTDSSDDGVFDAVDNCPDTSNATQQDSTGDGVGDACSDTPFCHVDSSEGTLEFDTVEFLPDSFAIPATAEGRWLPIVGTGPPIGGDDGGENQDEGSDSTVDSQLLLLDRRSGQWHDKGSIEFRGTHRFITATNTGGFVISPGIRDDAEPIGHWTQVSPSGEVSYGPEYSYYGYSNTILSDATPIRFPDGSVEHLRVDELTNIDGIATGMNFYLREVGENLNFGFTQSLDQYSGTDEPNSYDEFAGPPQTLRYPDGTAGFSLWHPGDSTLYLFDVTAPRSAPWRMSDSQALSIPEEIELSGDGEDDEPIMEDFSDFHPIAVPAPGGQLYVFDRHTGRAGRFVAERHEDTDSPEQALFERTWGGFERIPEYDLQDIGDFHDLSVYLLPDAVGLGIVGRLDEGSTQLHVREFYFHCHGQTGDFDTSSDGVGDLVDNCPLDDTPDQPDLDGDTWGDACDPDIDGDRIPNDIDIQSPEDGPTCESQADCNDTEVCEDAICIDPDDAVDESRDSNNDSVPNDEAGDGDDDGDNISNRYDPFAFDSANDGTPNLWSSDASGNSFSDSHLRDRDLDPYDFFSLPAGQDFLFLEKDDSGQRTLYRGDIDNAWQTTEIELPDGLNPHHLSYGSSDDIVYFLDGAPEETNRFVAYDLSANEIHTEIEIYPDDSPLAAIRRMSMIDLETYLVIHQTPDDERWYISEFSPVEVGYDRQGLDAINDAFNHFWYAHRYEYNGETITFFVGAETDCRECAAPYRYYHDTGEFELIQIGRSTVDAFAAQDDAMAFVASPIDGDSPPQLRHLQSINQYTFGHVDIEDGYGLPESLSLSQRRDANGEVMTGFVPLQMTTMSYRDQPSTVWIRIPGLSDWHRLVAGDDPIVEAAWRP